MNWWKKTWHLPKDDKALLEYLRKSEDHTNRLRSIVAAIIQKVADEGTAALLDYTEKFDGVRLKPGDFVYGPSQMKDAFDRIDPELEESLELAGKNIREYHEKQLPVEFSHFTGTCRITQKIEPVERIGIYVPGGLASYPSSVLMCVIPARVAGVKRVIVASPPNRKTGRVNELVLAAAWLSGADVVYAMGGAQAVAAMAHGTDDVTRVDRIVGPGNAFVAEAKRQVFGQTGIDSIAGPSEVLIIADGTANAAAVAADLLAQAEHGMGHPAILISASMRFLDRVRQQVSIQLRESGRRNFASSSSGALVHCTGLAAAFSFSAEFAPEHLSLQLRNPGLHMSKVHNAGAVFAGYHTPVAAGDYLSGPSHVLPTNGTARFSSGLSVHDFIRRFAVVQYSLSGIKKDAPHIARLARAEGLVSHAISAEMRIKEKS